ncbi:MAG: bestrophin family ion channel [Nannocystaceae bacterium]
MLIEKRLPLRYVIRKVGRETLIVLTIAIAVELIIRNQRGFLPEISIAIPTFLGTAITLLLSFRINQSYDRWWEARKIWGAIVNDSRTLVRQILSFVREPTPLLGRMTHRQIAWCYSLGQSLRGVDWTEGTERHLRAEDAADAEMHANKPLALVQQQARDLAVLARDGAVSDYQRIAVDDTLTRLVDSMGRAERIRSTVFPTTYRIFLYGFIYLFITILSIALGEIEGAWQVLVTTVISIPFFLLEKTARHMQDPFSGRPTDTAVTSIARTIEINLLQLLGETDTPPPLEPDGFYLR